MKHQTHLNFVALVACTAALLSGLMAGETIATEVYSWTDAKGVVHYGDRPPQDQKAQAVDVSESYRPSTSSPYPGPDEPVVDDAGDLAGDPDEPVLTPAQQKRKDIALARKEKRESQADMDHQCTRHRDRLAQVEPHRRVYYTDDKGETVRMDDNKRIELVEESKAFIAENCN